MHTGVKSFGWENSTAHELPIQSWNLMLPCVVSASKSGAVSPILSVILVYLLQRMDALGPAGSFRARH